MVKGIVGEPAFGFDIHPNKGKTRDSHGISSLSP